MPSRRFALCGLASAVTLFALCMGVLLVGAPVRRAPAAVPGAPALSFTLPDAESRLVSLDELRGRVVLLCIADPRRAGSTQYSCLAELQRNYRGEPRVAPMTVVRTDVEPGSVRARDLCQNLAAAGLSGTQVLDVSSDVWRSYRAVESTTLFVIDSVGVIRHRSNLTGDRNSELAAAEAAINKLLPGTAAVASVARR